jgi:hypothetical protein
MFKTYGLNEGNLRIRNGVSYDYVIPVRKEGTSASILEGGEVSICDILMSFLMVRYPYFKILYLFIYIYIYIYIFVCVFYPFLF